MVVRSDEVIDDVLSDSTGVALIEAVYELDSTGRAYATGDIHVIYRAGPDHSGSFRVSSVGEAVLILGTNGRRYALKNTRGVDVMPMRGRRVAIGPLDPDMYDELNDLYQRTAPQHGAEKNIH